MPMVIGGETLSLLHGCLSVQTRVAPVSMTEFERRDSFYAP